MSIQEDTLHVDKDGYIRDTQLELLYDHLYDNKNIDNIFKDNIKHYCKEIYPEAYLPTEKVFTDEADTLKWAMQFGPITVWIVDPEDYPKVSEEYGKKVGAKLGPLDHGKHVLADTVLNAILLSVIQVYREIIFIDDNEKDQDEIIH